MKTKYWIIVASRDHVQKGVCEGFCQACHGKAMPMKRMHPGDGVLFYSPKERFGKPVQCRRFTAIGRIQKGEAYQVEQFPGFEPFRRNVKFFDCQEISIVPLLDELGFIQNKQSWGYVFRFGFFEIPETDFNLIAGKMLELQSITNE